MIKTVKSCLYKTVGRSKLSYDEMLTLLSSIQYIVNSRPLTYTSLEDNITPISPNSFLRPHSQTNILYLPSDEQFEITEPSFETLNKTLSHHENLYLKFKQQWFELYLIGLRESHLQYHHKEWYNRVNLGDVVLIRHPSKTRPFWQMGKVLETFSGDDGCIRSVKVQAADKRVAHYSINYLFPLELSISHNGASAISKPIVQPSHNTDLEPVLGDISPVRNPHRSNQRQAAIKCRARMRECLDD